MSLGKDASERVAQYGDKICVVAISSIPLPKTNVYKRIVMQSCIIMLFSFQGAPLRLIPFYLKDMKGLTP